MHIHDFFFRNFRNALNTASGKASQSPSRIATPKKYNIAPSTTPVSRPRTPNKVVHNTPKKNYPTTK